ncbi:MAG: membrane dipeptidase [bacterium]
MTGQDQNPVSPLPICDLHCDLSVYMATVDGAAPDRAADIGCAVPFLEAGNVKFQVMAIYSGEGPEAVPTAVEQAEWIRRLVTESTFPFHLVTTPTELEAALQAEQIGVVAAIENASGLVSKDEPLATAWQRLERITALTGRLIYISLTHFDENRFGGGNDTTVGLKPDGRALLERLHAQSVAVDLAHASDALAFDILDFLTRQGLDVPVMASHSNFREQFDHPRNLPTELAQEIVGRGGLIGMNFMRAYIHPDNPAHLLNHIRHGFETGAGQNLCFGADFFYTRDYPRPDAQPCFYPEHEHAGRYPELLAALAPELDPERLAALAYGNVLEFCRRFWG